MKSIKNATLDFEKVIKQRNLRETLAAIFVIGIYGFSGLKQNTFFEAMICYIIVLSAVFIIIYMNYYSSKNIIKKNNLKSSEHLKNYTQSLKNQIKLLGSVRYWYITPIIPALLMFDGYKIYKALQMNQGFNLELLSIGIILIISLFIIYINEYRGVKELKRELNKLKHK